MVADFVRYYSRTTISHGCSFAFLPVCLFACLPVCLFVFLSFCLFVFLSFCPFVLLSFCPFVFLSPATTSGWGWLWVTSLTHFQLSWRAQFCTLWQQHRHRRWHIRDIAILFSIVILRDTNVICIKISIELTSPLVSWYQNQTHPPTPPIWTYYLSGKFSKKITGWWWWWRAWCWWWRWWRWQWWWWWWWRWCWWWWWWC